MSWPNDFAYDQHEHPTNDLDLKVLRDWLAFKLHCAAKYGLEAVAITYRKATSRRLVLLIERFDSP